MCEFPINSVHQDAKLVVEKFKSGFYPPKDKEFEDYTSPQYNQSAGDDHANSPRNSMNVGKAANKKGLSWLFGGKKVVLLNHAGQRVCRWVFNVAT